MSMPCGQCGFALAATGAAVGLAETGNTAVIAYQEGAACLAVILVLAVLRHVALVDAAVVVQQDGWNIQSIGARHTVFAVVARHGGVLQHSLGGIFQQGKLLFRTWNKRGEGTQGCLADAPCTSFRLVRSAHRGKYLRIGRPRKPRSPADGVVSDVPSSGRQAG